ncbi:unnamed protein product [Owenia fusiformis]|uniref:Uncharacterized protein n=1 Tax=Owenia fusiformis TaxID=6347 RepID=A0A8S4Q8C7_OWEFU|nr:unnamed protein product [Owenia fusiformis]
MVDIAGVVVLAVFYLIILGVGIIAAKFSKTEGASETERSLVAGRQLNLGVGIISMAASYIGGGFLNGYAESVARDGVIWMLMPVGLTLALFICTSLNVLIGLDFVLSVVVSAVIAALYTMIGQMIAVVYTNVLELAFIVIGLAIAIPFAATNENVDLTSLSETPDRWLGTIEPIQIASYIDLVVVLWVIGSIPWHSSIQRFLSAKSVRDAKIMGLVGGSLFTIIGVAPITIGVIGLATDWNNTSYGEDPIQGNKTSMILPLVVYHLTPRPVAVIALCSLVAAVMSSIESMILGSSGMFTQNVYVVIIHKKASAREIMWVRRITMFVLGVVSSIISIYGENTVIGLYYVCSEITIVVIFPQLLCSMYIEVANGYGALLGSALGLVLLFGKGIPSLNLLAFIPYPPYDNRDDIFPVRSLSVIVTILSTVVISCATKMMFTKRLLARKLDILNQFTKVDLERGANDENEHSIRCYDNPLNITDNTKL